MKNVTYNDKKTESELIWKNLWVSHRWNKSQIIMTCNDNDIVGSFRSLVLILKALLSVGGGGEYRSHITWSTNIEVCRFKSTSKLNRFKSLVFSPSLSLSNYNCWHCFNIFLFLFLTETAVTSKCGTTRWNILCKLQNNHHNALAKESRWRAGLQCLRTLL